jgi:hypothetical protein
MEKHPRNYEFNLPYYRKTVELLEKKQRPHGEWSALEYGYKCSVCTAAFYTHSNFCPNCGADMRTQNDRSWDTSERGASGSVENSITQKEGEAE